MEGAATFGTGFAEAADPAGELGERDAGPEECVEIGE